MAQPHLTNKYTHRKVAETSAKPCWICFKPSTSVLITDDNKDFFYICPGHLKDRGFAVPDAAEVAAIAERQKHAELVRQGEAEYAEMQRLKKAKEKEKKKDDKEKDEKGGDETKKEDAKDEGDDAKKDTKSPNTSTPIQAEEPRTFSLSKSFHDQRISRLRNADIAKRNRERLKNPSLFPSVPKGAPGSASSGAAGPSGEGDV